MNESPLFDKMDALLKKHRGPGSSAAPPAQAAPVPSPSAPVAQPRPRRAPPSGAWLPVLTDVIEPGTRGIASLLSHPQGFRDDTTIVDSQLAGQLLAELAPRLSEAMKKQVAEELRRNLDHTVAELLDRLDVSVRELARAALAERRKHTDAPR